jgi:uncharacterized protein
MRMVFVNLPVKDLEASKRFYTALGFEENAEFSDESAAGMVLSDQIWVMLLTEERFSDFIKGEVADATRTTEVINALSADSREDVDQTVDRALAAGGQSWMPVMEEGPMYVASIQDPDGHVWELVHMEQG